MIYKYSGAGNDFVVVYERVKGEKDEYRSAKKIQELCNRNSGFVAADGRIGADGLMILTESEDYDFEMDYYNSDGSGGMMCGNGGRCIVAFANFMGIKPCSNKYIFKAPDGVHSGEILEDNSVKIKMIDPFGFYSVLGGFFINTGTRHFVKFVPDVEAIDIALEGPKYRYSSEFAPEGVNVNFVQICEDCLKVRTFEKGVEAETLACGTGVTAAAIVFAIYCQGTEIATTTSRLAMSDIRYCKSSRHCEGAIATAAILDPIITTKIQTRIATLSVEFQLSENNTATEVYLTGPAEMVQ